MKRFHTEKWISTLVPAPKRSTLGVVAALDSVVGLCAGIESNISKNKDTQLYVHSDSKSWAFTKMSQEERCGKAEQHFCYWTGTLLSGWSDAKSNGPKVKREYFQFPALELVNLEMLTQNLMKATLFLRASGGQLCQFQSPQGCVHWRGILPFNPTAYATKHPEPKSVTSRRRKTTFFQVLPASTWLIIKTCWATSVMTETNVHIHKYYGFNTETPGECHHQDVFLILFSFSRGGQDALSDK